LHPDQVVDGDLVKVMMMGSVADRVIRTASCPVLVVGGRH
jgi:nucleotide-binding universal stress UspA family protein